jgi:DNA-binding transcriptional MerR regulator
MGTMFEDGKDSGAFRTIGELSMALGLKPHVLRYWEQQFPQLQPLKRSGGRRYYRPADVALVETIDRLVNREGYTLKGAKKVLAAGGGAVPAEPIGPADFAVPTDGGVDAFFGSAAAAPEKAPSLAIPETERFAALVPPDIIAELRAIRTRLAAALEA